jgi:tetratricopeptide (TPR) repeat protein
MDVNTIIKMGFFIADLHRHIKQLHSEQFGGHHSDKTFTVYRGQVMSKEGFGQLRKRQGGLMSFNNFLSTSKDRQISLQFAYQAVENPDLVGVLFIMTIDPSQSTVPFAATTDVSYNNKADEVLFSMHTVFRIHNIKPLDKNNHLFEVNLALTNDTDQDLCVLANRIREETSASTNGWYRLSQLLLEMGKIDEAQQINNALLKQTTNDTENGDNYEQLGRGKYHQGDYKEALKFYEKALELRQKTLPSNHPNLASSYFNIGLVYFNTGEYLKALSYHEKVLEIRQQSLHPSHPDLASSYNNIGLVYFNMANYSKALSYHEKALEIQQKGLPPNHPDLASSYNNIGLVYFNVSDYSKALSYHEKALEIRQQSLPPGHPQIVSSYKKIGLVYEKMEEYPKALSYYDKVLQMQQKVLPPNHPDLAASCNNIGCIYAKMNEYSKSLFYYERAVEIGQHSLPSNHPDLEEYRKNLDQVKKKL